MAGNHPDEFPKLRSGLATAQAAGALPSLWRTSSFVSIDGGRAHHDLTGKSMRMSAEERRILQRGMDNALTVERAAADCRLPVDSIRSSIDNLFEQGWIVANEMDESASFKIDWVDIETCRQCNARCGFCPQSTNPKTSGVMADDVFRRIASAVAPHRPRSVALNHYGEPLLDPHFRDRCEILKGLDLPVLLFTNGTLLNEATSKFLAEECLLWAVVFNYPSIRAGEWSTFMGLPERFHSRATEAIRRTAKSCTQPVEIFVNGVTECQERRSAEIHEAFQSFPNVRVKHFISDDRAGSQPKLVAITDPAHGSRLFGCDRVLRYIHFRHDGAVYLCCQDYEQKVLLGDIKHQTPTEIMTGAEARRLRRQIYGMEQAPDNLLCRSCSRIRKSRDSTAELG